ncbi:MAG: hypothetical protein Q7J73_05040, partial [Dehalococcoidales bacterium]|nr:hypothetical protein [Dehalococcoidales bacterium]
ISFSAVAVAVAAAREQERAVVIILVLMEVPDMAVAAQGGLIGRILGMAPPHIREFPAAQVVRMGDKEGLPVMLLGQWFGPIVKDAPPSPRIPTHPVHPALPEAAVVEARVVPVELLVVLVVATDMST